MPSVPLKRLERNSLSQEAPEQEQKQVPATVGNQMDNHFIAPDFVLLPHIPQNAGKAPARALWDRRRSVRVRRGCGD